MKRGDFCRGMVLAMLLGWLSAVSAQAALTNGLALTPPMGFNAWYEYGPSINESLVESIADQMATNGMLAAGYQYINLDDSWMGYRNTNGVMVADQSRFPDGIAALAAYVHAKGFKFGLYTTDSSNTCAGYPGSLGYEVLDANTYASWGVDYVKYELCSLSGFEAAAHGQIYTVRMGQALLNSGRPMVFSVSIGTFENWIPNYMNLWRGTGDITSDWDTILSHIDYVSQTPSFAGPGGWNDEDVLEVGNGALNAPQEQAVFSMWCILTGPLLVMNSGTTATNILCNRDAIAVDQDPAGIQGICVWSNANLEVYSKPLGGSNSTTVAVALFNRGTNSGTITANWSAIGLPASEASVWDIWAQGYVGNFTNSYTATVPGESVQFLRIASGATVPLPPVGTNYLSDLPVMADYTNAMPLQRDESAIGGPITLRGTNYPKGLGMTAYSRDVYYLGGTATNFQAEIGLDDAAGPGAAADFRVYLDGNLVYDSWIVTTATPVQSLNFNVTGVTELTLEVSNVVSGATNNFADWAEARVIVPASPTALFGYSTQGDIDLVWDPPPGAIGYEVLRSTNGGASYTQVSSPGTNGYTDTNVQPDVVYYYEVSATTTNGETVDTAPVTVELTPYWTNLVTSAPQNWNADGNWSNTATFPNSVGRMAIINTVISTNQTILLNQQITVGSLNIGSGGSGGSYTIAGSGGSLVFENGEQVALLTQFPPDAGDTIAAAMTFNGDGEIYNGGTNALTLSGTVTASGIVAFFGPVNLEASNLFAGSVDNIAGTLVLRNAGALAGSPYITIGPGAILDTSALGAPGLALTNGQTLIGGGTVNGNLQVDGGGSLILESISDVMVFNGQLTLEPGAICIMQMSTLPVTNAMVEVSGTLNYGGSLYVDNTGLAPFAAGQSFQLFSAATYAGAFTNIAPATPGPGLLWDMSGLTRNGTLLVVTNGPLTVNFPKVSGRQVVFSATGGTPNGALVVLMSTNAGLPLSQWTRMTNSFDGAGYFTFTNALGTNGPAMFYRLQPQ